MRDVPDVSAEEFERRRASWMAMVSEEVVLRHTWNPLSKCLNLVVCSETSMLFFGFAEAAKWLCGQEDRSAAQGILRACKSEDGRPYRNYHWVLLPPPRAGKRKVDDVYAPRIRLAPSAEIGSNTTTATGSDK